MDNPRAVERGRISRRIRGVRGTTAERSTATQRTNIHIRHSTFTFLTVAVAAQVWRGNCAAVGQCGRYVFNANEKGIGTVRYPRVVARDAE